MSSNASPTANISAGLRPPRFTSARTPSPTDSFGARPPRFTSPANAATASGSRTSSPTDRHAGRPPRFTAATTSASRTPSPTEAVRGALQPECEREPPSPPPSRPRSSSMPVSMGTGRMRSVRPDERASELGNGAVPGSGDVAMTDVAPTTAAPSSPSADVTMADEFSIPTLYVARPRPTAQLLPLDVLSPILLAWYAAELNESEWRARRVPFLALAICSSWRQAAQCTHHLWTDARFTLSTMLAQPRWLAYQECFARYSGAVSISNAHIFCNAAVAPHGDASWELFRTSILPRARTIDVEIDELSSYTGVLVDLTLPHLTTLRITSSHHLLPQEYPAFKLHLRAPLLSHFTFLRTFMEFDDPFDSEHNPLWGVATMQFERAQYTLGELRGLASVTPLMREFSMTATALWDTEDDPFVWARLEALRVDVQSVYSDLDGLPHRVQLPALKLLEIRDIKYNWAFWREFAEVSCPVLETLCVRRNHMDQGQEFVDGMGSLSKIRRLIMRDGSLNEHIVGLLAFPRSNSVAFPNLRELVFENTVAKPGFRFPGLQKFLQLRYAHLARGQMGGAFDLRCAFRRRINDDAHNALQSQMEEVISGWNVAARQTYVGH